MIDQSKWKQKDVWVSSLQLDSRNPRIPADVVSQPDLLADLIEHEGVYELAKDIAEQGYYKLKNIIIVEEDGKNVVLEGNRRVAALKLLLSYKLAPQSQRSKFKRLSDKASIKNLKRIPALLVPSREAAAPVIMREHTMSQVKSWAPVMQARFYYEIIREGVSIVEIAKEYSIAPGDIKDFLQSYEMYRIACSLDLPEAIAAKVKDPRSFPLSTLDRIYSKPEVAAILGIEFDANKKLVGKVAVEEFKRAYAKVVTDVAMDVVNSRKLNNANDFQKYIDDIKKHAPDLKKKGTFTVETIAASESSKAAGVAKDQPTKTARPAPPLLALLPKTYNLNTTDQRVQAIIKELKIVPIKKCPNAVSVLVRVLLDITVGMYCDREGINVPILAKAKKENRPSDWYPTARQMLRAFVNSPQKAGVHPLVLKAAQKLCEDEVSPFSIMTLDAYVHNRFVTPTESELRSFWRHIDELVKTFAEPPSPASS